LEASVRKAWIVLIVTVCLVVIAIPAFVVTPQLPSPRVERGISPRPSLPDLPLTERQSIFGFHFDNPMLWMRLSPFGTHAEGWRGLVSAAASWVYLYILSVLVLVLVPRRIRLITRSLQSGRRRDHARFVLIGLLAVLASVSLGLLARYASVWFVLVVLLSGVVLLLSFAGILCISLMVGGMLRRWAALAPSLWVELALGSLIIFALGRIPFAGWVLFGIVFIWGLGAVLATHLGSGEAWSLRDWQVGN
jgi:hypothetical protein